MSRRADHLQRQLGEGYRILQRLGRGGMGEVWAARDLELDCIVAIKVLDDALSRDDAFVARFRREMKTLAKFAHARIVRIKTTGVLAEDGRLYMVMEHLPGKTLRTLLDEHRLAGTVIDPVSAAFYAFQIVDALRTAHAHAIVHGDIKPENMIVDAAGHLTLLDFGVAKAAELGPRGERTSQNGGIAARKKSTPLGTLRYVAPELVAHGTFDARSDLYAVGVMLIMMLTGEYLYEVDADDETGILDAHVHDPPVLRKEKNPACPEALWAIALRLVAKDPADRYQTAVDVGDALSAVMRGSLPPAHPIAQKLLAERREQAHRKAFERRAVPNGQPAEAAPAAPEATAPLRASAVPESPCSPSANALEDVTIRVASPRVAPSPLTVDVSRLLARPGLAAAVTQTAPIVARRARSMVPAWVARPRAEARERQDAPPPRRQPRASRIAVLTGIAVGVLLAWGAFVMAVLSMRSTSFAGAAATTATATRTATTIATVTAAPTATATAATSATTRRGATLPAGAPARTLPF